MLYGRFRCGSKFDNTIIREIVEMEMSKDSDH